MAFFLAFDHRVRRFGFEARHFHGARRTVVEQPHRVLVRLNHADPAAFGFKRNQFAPHHRNNRDVASVHRLLGFQLLDGVDGRPIQNGLFLDLRAGVSASSCRAAFGNRVFHRLRPVVQQHLAACLVFQPVILRNTHGTGCAFAAGHPMLRRRTHRGQFVLGVARHQAVGIPALIGVPRHVVRQERPLPIRVVRFLRERVQHHAALLEDALNNDALVKRVVAIRVRLRNDAVIATPSLDGPFKRPASR